MSKVDITALTINENDDLQIQPSLHLLAKALFQINSLLNILRCTYLDYFTNNDFEKIL